MLSSALAVAAFAFAGGQAPELATALRGHYGIVAVVASDGLVVPRLEAHSDATNQQVRMLAEVEQVANSANRFGSLDECGQGIALALQRLPQYVYRQWEAPSVEVRALKMDRQMLMFDGELITASPVDGEHLCLYLLRTLSWSRQVKSDPRFDLIPFTIASEGATEIQILDAVARSIYCRLDVSGEEFRFAPDPTAFRRAYAAAREHDATELSNERSRLQEVFAAEGIRSATDEQILAMLEDPKYGVLIPIRSGSKLEALAYQRIQMELNGAAQSIDSDFESLGGRSALADLLRTKWDSSKPMHVGFDRNLVVSLVLQCRERGATIHF